MRSDEVLTKFDAWFADAKAREIDVPDAMALATVGADGRPSVRMVLLKAWDEHGFVFHTNHHSRKAVELLGAGFAAATLHWKSLERQVHLEGPVAKTSDAESDAYFATRPRGSQIGAWASLQGEPLPDRETLEARVEAYEHEFPGEVPRPPHWGGFRITPVRFEFWQGRSDRLHDRSAFEREIGGPWRATRLYP